MDNNKTKNEPVGLFADKALKDEPINVENSTTAPTQPININKTSASHTANVATSIDTSSNSIDEAGDSTTRESKKTTIASGEALKLAVVGHTNTGKTSILRTLLRDVYFGEVKNEAATTRHVERAQLTDSQTGEVLVALYDTPGLEDASGLMDWLEDNTASRRDGIERLQQFLAADIAQGVDALSSNEDYSQEAKVIRQLLASDMAVYVV
ncbi:GTPase, partial [Psychrobacter glaciei]